MASFVSAGCDDVSFQAQEMEALAAAVSVICRKQSAVLVIIIDCASVFLSANTLSIPIIQILLGQDSRPILLDLQGRKTVARFAIGIGNRTGGSCLLILNLCRDKPSQGVIAVRPQLSRYTISVTRPSLSY